MSVSKLVTDLTSMGVELELNEDQIRFKAPVGTLTAEHKRLMKAHKQELIAYLRVLSKRAQERGAVERYEAFPLTDLQLAYVVGRTNAYELGGVGCHSYIELDLPPTDVGRLERAWHRLIARHDMLRCVFLADGRQRVQREVALPAVPALDLRGASAADAERSLLALRDELSHRRYDPECWPMFDVRLTHLDGSAVLHFSIDLLIADFASIQVLLAELGEAYYRPQHAPPNLTVTFREVVLAQKAAQGQSDARREEDHRYWSARAEGLPGAPELPRLAMGQPLPARFARYHFELPEEHWRVVRRRAGEHQLTPSSVVLAAFTEILARWSRNPDFSIALTLFNRPEGHSDIQAVIGDFIAVSVLAVLGTDGATFAERTASLQRRLWEDMEHSAFSGVEVMRMMSQRAGEPWLVPVVYTSTIGVDASHLPNNDFMRRASLRFGITQTPQVWLDCQTTERDGRLHLDWDVRDGVFPAGMIEDAFGALGRLLSALATSPEPWCALSPVLLPAGTVQSRQRVNDTASSIAPELLHTGFCRQTLEQPSALAVSAADRAVSYGELARWAYGVTDRLLEAGARPGERVAVVLDKSCAQIAAVLGALLAAGSYVPLDPAQPLARRNAMLSDASVRWVLTDTPRRGESWPEGVEVLVAPELDDCAESESSVLSRLRVTLAEQAVDMARRAREVGYIIFTSGSTGRPKGVMMSHLGAFNTVRDINRRLDVSPRDRVLGLAQISFDLSVWDTFGTLAAGAALVLPDPAQRSDPGHWAALLESKQVTLWNSVPAQMQMLVDYLEWRPQRGLESLRVAMLSGDSIPVSLPDRVRASLPGVAVISLGGPTETAIWCVWHPIGEVPAGARSVPYGVALTNHQVHVLNTRLEVCPDFVPGELFIGGSGLAEGYVGDPGKTAASFTRHPVTGQRLYRSGDIGRCDREGVIEFLGREDHQVKLRGHRIELGEVEAACAGLAEVRRAVALVSGSPAMVSVVVVPVQPELDSEAVIELCRTVMGERLPEYMVPSEVVVMAELPLSANGKLDRKRLLEQLVGRRQPESVVDEPPQGPHELALADAWAEVLGRPVRSRHAEFFGLGGSSVAAVQLLGALQKRGYPATLELVFGKPVLQAMAESLAQAHAVESNWLDFVDLETLAEEALANMGDAGPVAAGGAVRTLLLTGATGFLGGYILHELLARSDWSIRCLVRADDESSGRQRLQQSLDEKGLSVDWARVQVEPGDLERDGLGVPPPRYAELAAEVDAVIHNASIINLMDPLSRLYPTNVQGAARVLSFATTAKIKPVHYVSTIAVHHALPEEPDEGEECSVPEATRIRGWAGSRLTYEQSKIMAETLFHRARERGVPVNILRPATIGWASTGGAAYINDDAFLKFYRACLHAGAYPTSPLRVNLVPVDVVAEGIVLVAREAGLASRNYHLVARRSVTVDRVYGWLNGLGCDFAALPPADWMARIDDPFVAGFVNLYFEGAMQRGGHRQYEEVNLDSLRLGCGGRAFELSGEYFKPLAERFGPTGHRRGSQPRGGGVEPNGAGQSV